MTVIDFTEATRRHMRPIEHETVRDEVLRRLRGRVCGLRIVQAQARAERNFDRGTARNLAVARAVSWALCAIDPDPSEAA